MNNRMVVMTFHDVAPDELEKLHKAFVELGDEVGRSRNFNVIDPTTDGTSMKTTCFAGSKPLGVADVNEVGEVSIFIEGSYGSQLYNDLLIGEVVGLNIQKRFNGVGN